MDLPERQLCNTKGEHRTKVTDGMNHLRLASFVIGLAHCSAAALASDSPPSSSAASGSSDVLVEGQPTKRAGDIPGAIISPNVIINGQPVITGCSEGTPILSPSVMINGKPKILGCRK